MEENLVVATEEKCLICDKAITGNFFYQLALTGSFEASIGDEKQTFSLKLTGAGEKICSDPLCVARAVIKGIKEFFQRQKERRKIFRAKFGGS